MYGDTSKIVYRAFKRRVLRMKFAKSIHSHLLALWARRIPPASLAQNFLAHQPCLDRTLFMQSINASNTAPSLALQGFACGPSALLLRRITSMVTRRPQSGSDCQRTFVLAAW